jgi:hypothetical protein
MIDVSGVGLVVNIKASNTFPSGFAVTQFADDGDSITFDEMEIGGSAMGLNGDLVTWDKVAPINVPINVIPNGDDDINLGILFEANRAGRGKKTAKDVITMTVIYPNGKSTTLSGGRLLKGKPSNSVASEGRMTSKSYSFAFENITKS